jgi:hypothetical protein
MATVLFVIWRIVGGKLNFKTFFIVTCYFSGISTLLFAVFALLAGGLLKQMDPDNASQLLSGAAPAGPPSAGLTAYSLLRGVGFIAVYVWIAVGWGAYRKLEIRHEPTGWILCLSGRYAQQCFKAAKLPPP